METVRTEKYSVTPPHSSNAFQKDLVYIRDEWMAKFTEFMHMPHPLLAGVISGSPFIRLVSDPLYWLV